MKRLSIDIIRKSFEDEGYELLTTEYINNAQKLEYICPSGHRRKVKWNQWQYGQRCCECEGRNIITTDSVRSELEKEGYQLTSEYINARSYINFICPEGHNHYIKWRDWQDGCRCGKCRGKYKTDIDVIRKSFEDEGYELLSNEYHRKVKLKYKCPKGHFHSVIWNSWQQGDRCGKCPSNTKINYHDINHSFKSEGYQLLTLENDYINTYSQKLKFICPKGHHHSIKWDNWQNGVRCGKCNTSKPETQLLNYIKFTYPHLDIVHQDRTTIVNPSTGYNLEFDIWLPELNKAIEMNGVFIHSLKSRLEMDMLKNKLCKEKGIPLLVITDEEWYNCEDVRYKIHEFIRS